jgi:hypothetical protein
MNDGYGFRVVLYDSNVLTLTASGILEGNLAYIILNYFHLLPNPAVAHEPLQSLLQINPNYFAKFSPEILIIPCQEKSQEFQ